MRPLLVAAAVCALAVAADPPLPLVSLCSIALALPVAASDETGEGRNAAEARPRSNPTRTPLQTGTSTPAPAPTPGPTPTSVPTPVPTQAPTPHKPWRYGCHPRRDARDARDAKDAKDATDATDTASPREVSFSKKPLQRLREFVTATKDADLRDDLLDVANGLLDAANGFMPAVQGEQQQ